ncbi:MAG: YihY/virulence factor BrkB family protein [Candidatus Cloacimonadales bacterium]
MIHKLKDKLRNNSQQVWHFLHVKIWQEDLHSLSYLQGKAYRTLRILARVKQGLSKNDAILQAGSLTYLTLLALIPVLALMFTVSKGLDVHEDLVENLGLQIRPKVQTEQANNEPNFALEKNYQIIPQSRLASLPDTYQELIITLFSLVDRTEVGTLGLFGLLFLLWTIIKLMSTIEKAFNNIWQIENMRKFLPRVLLYFAILLSVPILVLLVSSINILLSSQNAMQLMQNYFGHFILLYKWLIRSLLFFVIGLIFIFLLKVMPNTKVKFSSAAWGGIITAILWFILQTIYFIAQSGVSMYNVIYGTFAALPFFLVWLHSSWLLLLVGAELSSVLQNSKQADLSKK